MSGAALPRGTRSTRGPWIRLACGRPLIRHLKRAVLVRAHLDPVAGRVIEVGDAVVGKILGAWIARSIDLPHVLEAAVRASAMQHRKGIGGAALRGAVVQHRDARPAAS